eukprot:TRINITY_DN3974_c0_g1_i2.p1 TRINITY_DN3974_c0_g1~~TRINITY_DN3974_c0_g1_i2.p1  ORF type:complete len:559 (+),score=149.28 TRINITY_DN3974_c0_g1_i2:365-2041(+)
MPKTRIQASCAVFNREDRVLRLCPRSGSCPDGKMCKLTHVSPPSDDVDGWEVALESVAVSGRLNVLDRNDRALFVAEASDATELTVGLIATVALRHGTDRRLQRFRALYAYLCQDFQLRGCPRGYKCPYLHYSPEHLKMLKMQEFPPQVHAGTSVLELLLAYRMPEKEATAFAERLAVEQGLATVGDVNFINGDLFHHISSTLTPCQMHEDFWAVLAESRALPPELSVRGAVAKFHLPKGESDQAVMDRAVADLEAAGVSTIAELRALGQKSFLSLKIPILMKMSLRRVRERYSETDALEPRVYDIEAINDQHLLDVLSMIQRKRTETHPSWRKGSARQLVTTAITFVTGDCRCHAKNVEPAAAPVVVRPPPRAVPLSKTGVRSVPYPGADRAAAEKLRCDQATRGGAGRPAGGRSDGEEPRRNLGIAPPPHWCSCAKDIVVSVNYELNTPAGSRCSEQNGLAVIASTKGVPTSAIRDVFVHGQGDRDPNPLLPCGVCENMFKKLTTDVFRTHGQDINLYMFGSQDAKPRRLLWMPMREISNRQSKRFMDFVTEQVRD